MQKESLLVFVVKCLDLFTSPKLRLCVMTSEDFHRHIARARFQICKQRCASFPRACSTLAQLCDTCWTNRVVHLCLPHKVLAPLSHSRDYPQSQWTVSESQPRP